MSGTPTPSPGSILWTDLTVPNAEAVRDFYREVAGWGVSPVEMGGYQDYTMTSPADGSAVAGVCHARGHQDSCVGLRLYSVYYVCDPGRQRSGQHAVGRPGGVPGGCDGSVPIPWRIGANRGD